MSEYFYNYFEIGWCAYAAVVSVCVFFAAAAMGVFRKITGGKFRAGWRYAVWTILPVCFLFPIRPRSFLTKIPLISVGTIPLHIYSAPLKLTEIGENSRFATTGEGAYAVFAYEYAVWIMLAGFVIALGFQLIKLFMLKNRVKSRGVRCADKRYLSMLENICRDKNIKMPELVIFPEADTPFAMGVFKPEIILPARDFSEEELYFILRHETVHIKRRDILKKLLMIIFRSANWYNPFAYVMCRQAFEDMEISCDEKASEGFSEEQRAKYSETILKGISKGKYPAVTTYLSSNARTVKKRINSVMTAKKISGLIPFAIAFPLIFLLSLTVYAYPDGEQAEGFYIYTDSFPFEEDPYITTTEWRSCEADSPAEAAEKIFCQYMDMYTGEDVPEYYRIEQYHINDAGPTEKAGSASDLLNAAMKRVFCYGLFDESIFCYVNYNFETANKCGNTVHNQNFGLPAPFNGIAENVFTDIELERKGKTYTLVTMGVTGASAFSHSFHFTNTQSETQRQLDIMAKCGALDRSFNDTDDLPDAEKLIASACLYNGNPNISSIESGFYSLPLRMKTESLGFYDEACKALEADGFVNEETGEIDCGKFPLKNAAFVYCGADYDSAARTITAYGNITGDDPHGVILRFAAKEERNKALFAQFSLVSAEVTNELFIPAAYRDSFGSIPFPAELRENRTASGAEKILEYMKAPREESDFTVLDYRNITKENGEIYAEVKFKGRLDGIYSSDLCKLDPSTHKPVSDGYIRSRIL